MGALLSKKKQLDPSKVEELKERTVEGFYIKASKLSEDTVAVPVNETASAPVAEEPAAPSAQGGDEILLEVKVEGTEVDATALAMAVGNFCGGAGATNGEPKKALLSKG